MNAKNLNLININEILIFIRLDKYSNIYNILKSWFTKINIFFKMNSKMFQKKINKILFIILYLKKSNS